jgi:hypothetical protein
LVEFGKEFLKILNYGYSNDSCQVFGRVVDCGFKSLKKKFILHWRSKMPLRHAYRRLLLILSVTGLLAAVFALSGCYPGGPQDLGDIGLALTYRTQEADYSGLMTYAMPDTVIALVNPDDDSSEPLDRRYDDLILTEIAAQLDARGFQRILDPDENNVPDVIVTAGAVQSDAYLVFQYWGYPGYGYPGWGWGYPGYPVTGVVQFKQGSIVWTMVDIRGLDPAGDGSEDATVLWLAGINGAMTGTGTNPQGDIPRGIAQCFIQSPYIQAEAGRN